MPVTVRAAEHADLDTIVAFNQRMAMETEGRSLAPAVIRQGVETVLLDPAKVSQIQIHYLAQQRRDAKVVAYYDHGAAVIMPFYYCFQRSPRPSLQLAHRFSRRYFEVGRIPQPLLQEFGMTFEQFRKRQAFEFTLVEFP